MPTLARALMLTTWIAAVLATAAPKALAAGAVTEAEPKLTIRSGSKSVEFKRSELLKRPDVTSIEVPHDPAYKGKPMKYKYAVPVQPLFTDVNVPKDALVQFGCLDGFSAPLSRDRLLEPKTGKTAVAYIAIESEVAAEKWPTVTSVGGAKSLGPFYLIWKDPEKSRIGTEEWPFALAGFVVQEPLAVTFPKIQPDPKLGATSAVHRGLAVFVKNCFACHTLNREGQSRIGPDLNVPMSPTEYFSEANLKKLVRNPQNLRAWPESKMNAFPKSVISDAELDDLVEYLKHMSSRKVAAPTAKSP